MPGTGVSQERVTNALQKVDVLCFAVCCLRDDKVLRGNSCNHSISLKPLLARNGQTWINPGITKVRNKSEECTCVHTYPPLV